jgi:hypothetical protein
VKLALKPRQELSGYSLIYSSYITPLTQDSNAQDLSAADWRVVLETNRLLHGFQIREQNQDVVRARCNGECCEATPHQKLNIPRPLF